MTIEVDTAIGFPCEYCGEYQYHEYSLTGGWYEDRAVNEDYIPCKKCGKENHVIEEL